MKAYIALSRVRKAKDILIADIMSPTLFRCGAHPWRQLCYRFYAMRGLVQIEKTASDWRNRMI
eukprot:1434367-Karenia_brevis.AAC.1